MKTLFFLVPILLFAQNTFSQVIDTCLIGETKTYYVKNQQKNSLLYWNVTGGEIISENPSKNNNIQVLWNNTGIQELSVYEKTISNCLGKTTTIQIMITNKDFDIELIIPNSFSPNNDNINEYFVIKANIPPDNYKISIFNRWGNKVFESNNINNSWNGENNTGVCNAGAYYYIIQYKNKDKIITKKGFLHLFR